MSNINKIIYEFYQQPMMMMPVPMQQPMTMMPTPMQQTQYQQTPVQKMQKPQSAKSLAGVNISTPRKTPNVSNIIRQQPQVQIVRQANVQQKSQQFTPTKSAIQSATNAKAAKENDNKK